MSDGQRIAVLLPSIELGTYWGPVITALDEAVGAARILTARAWPGVTEDPAGRLVTVVGRTRRLSTDAQAKAYGGGVMLLPLRVLWPLAKFRPDAVVVMGFSLWTILALLGRTLGRWSVVIMWEGSSPGVDHRGSTWRTRLRSGLARRADRMVTSNGRSRRYLVDHLGVRDEHVDVHPLLVPSPAALTAGDPDASGLAGVDSPVLLAVGRLEERKGLGSLLRALGRLGDLPWSLAIIGTGEQEPELRRIAAESGIGDRVRWLGWVRYADLGAYLAAADLLTFTTFEDTWGMVATEAMALGTPVLCSIHAGASEVLSDGEDGILVDPHDPDDVTRRLREALTTMDLSALGRRAARAVASHTPEATAAVLARAASTTTRR